MRNISSLLKFARTLDSVKRGRGIQSPTLSPTPIGIILKKLDDQQTLTAEESISYREWYESVGGRSGNHL